MTQAISGASLQAASATHAVRSARPDADGDNDGSGSAPANNVGPAVVLSLSNTQVSDAAAGDPDHDGH